MTQDDWESSKKTQPSCFDKSKGNANKAPRPTAESSKAPPAKKAKGQQGGTQAPQSYAVCKHCNKRHPGVCYRISGACLRCGKQGHFIKDCPMRPAQEGTALVPRGPQQ